MKWIQLLSAKRLGLEHLDRTSHNRTEFQRDYDRLIFSAPFRRLQNKTQVFPLPGSVFVHNRLTHSLEVSCVGRSLGNSISQKLLLSNKTSTPASLLAEIGSIVAAACLAHDMGNPPFGHSGEQTIATYFSEGQGKELEAHLDTGLWQDLTHFEGNANVFRLLTHQFKGRRKGGFALTYSTLSSVVKYPHSSGLADQKYKFGFFNQELETYQKIANELGLKQLQNSPIEYARHPLVYLVEAADDICYQLMDIEDAHKLRILSTDEAKFLLLSFLTPTQIERAYQVFSQVTDINEQIAYLRSIIIGVLIQECTEIFCRNEQCILDGEFKKGLMDYLSPHTQSAYRNCQETAIKRIYNSREVLDVELAGNKIIKTLLDSYIDAIKEPSKSYSQLLLNRVSNQYDIKSKSLPNRVMAVIDFISGMTDVYALDLYRKINGHSLPSI